MRPLPPIACALASFTVFACSDPPAEVEIEETRELTTLDDDVALHKSSWARFRPGERNYVYTLPEGWVKERPTSMRKVNLATGGEAPAEVYVSESRGSLYDNVNRWRGQFGLEPISEVEVNLLPRVPALGTELTLVEATGTYEPGMGQPPRGESGLAGVIGSTGDGVITIKMVGPASTVAAERERFLVFCAGLELES